MSCTLILMRHSHAAAEHSCPDFERQLTESGVELAKATAELLCELDVVPDLIVASSAVRTMTTAQSVAEQFECIVPVSSCDNLYQAGPSAYLPAIQAAAVSGKDTIMLIGHNPAIGTLISALSGQHVSVPPATLGAYSIDTADWFGLRDLIPEQATLKHFIVNARECQNQKSCDSSP